MSARLSLTMIVKDEEATLGRVLGQAAQVCDELVVADTGSTDRTREVALDHGARLVAFPWVDDFGAARNASLDACTGDWVLWLDADDVLTPDVVAALATAKQTLLTDDLDVVTTPYRYHFSTETGECTFSLHRERLVRRVPGLRWVGPVHEVLSSPGTRSVHREDLYVEHRPDPLGRQAKSDRNLRILQGAVAGGDRSPRTLYYYAGELRDSGRDEESLVAYEEYLSGPAAGWERYDGLLNAARAAGQLGREVEVVRYLRAAQDLDGSRAEAFLELGWRHFQRQEWAAALPLYAAAGACRRPTEGFVSPADYTWRPPDHLGVCLINLGGYEEGISSTLRSLAAGNPDRERLRANLHWAVDQL